jgi:hypothetical protein
VALSTKRISSIPKSGNGTTFIASAIPIIHRKGGQPSVCRELLREFHREAQLSPKAPPRHERGDADCHHDPQPPRHGFDGRRQRSR